MSRAITWTSIPDVAERSWTFEWRRTWDEVFDAAFVARWNALRSADSLSTVYHRPEVVRAWAESCGDSTGCEPLFGVASKDGAAVLLPWIVSNVRGRLMTRRVIESVGQDHFGYHDPIVAGRALDATEWNGLWDAARSATASFGHQGFLRSVHPERAGDSRIATEQTPILGLDHVRSLDELLARCSANHRGDVQRCMRRLAGRGKVSLDVMGPASGCSAFDDLCQAYAERREERPEYLSLDRPGLRDLWRRVATDGVAQGWGHFAALTVDSEPIAWHLGLFDRQALFWWVPTYARAHQGLSPGKILLASLVAHGIESGWRCIHFLTGAQPYKLAWRPEVATRYAVRWHAPTLIGALLSRYDQRAAG
jgi:CelD/BcsL family acetyltransferase involved in cellulose biosynthesis